MSPLSNAALERLRRAADAPDFSGTRYELVEPLGRGGMGVVFLARDRELGREVAIKVLADPEPDPDAVERLRDEARILARLEHPGIVPVHDAGTLPDGRVYYAMKRVRGTRLDDLADTHPPLAERLRWFERVCETVAFAHGNGVLHRDLKPENVMVGSYGEVLVMDWGLARFRGDDAPPAASAAPDAAAAESSAPPAPVDSRATRDGTIVGTPGYMSPEQARGETRAIDERSEVYALGALLRFLITGSPSPAPAAARDVPVALAAIAARATAPEPSHRYASTAELRDDLRRWLDGVAVRAHRETVLDRAARLGRRYRVPIALVGAYLVMRVVVLVLARR